MPRKLTDLRPCDNCTKPIGQIFYVVRFSLAVVNARAVNQMLGMHHFFGGKAGMPLIENFAPEMAQGFTIAMDEKDSAALGTEAFLCNICMMEPIDLQMLSERINERKRASGNDDV